MAKGQDRPAGRPALNEPPPQLPYGAPAREYREPSPAKRRRYTPEYWEAHKRVWQLEEQARLSPESFTELDKRELISQRAELEAEANLSEAARRYGFMPGEMDTEQWGQLARQLKESEGETSENYRRAMRNWRYFSF